jgi:uncharacterized membrane protein
VSKRPTVVEQTAKRWKAVQGLGCLGTLAGVVLIGIGIAAIDRTVAHQRMSPALVIGVVCIVVGLPAYAFGRVGGWWFHG